MTSARKNLCVYCGSGTGRDPLYMAAANQLGREIAAAGLGLVYGGGNLGLMGEVARSALEHGGHVTGIIPKFLMTREKMLTSVQELIVTGTMHERKMAMFERADGFVALPGGIGTLEEVVEMATWAQLGQHSKPIILCNIAGYWDPLVALVSHMRDERFIRPDMEFSFTSVRTPGEVVSAFHAACPA